MNYKKLILVGVFIASISLITTGTGILHGLGPALITAGIGILFAAIILA